MENTHYVVYTCDHARTSKDEVWMSGNWLVVMLKFLIGPGWLTALRVIMAGYDGKF